MAKNCRSCSKTMWKRYNTKVNKVCNVNELASQINEFDSVIVAYENEEKYSIKDEIDKIKNKNNINKIAIVIGPEGRNR